MRQVKMNLFTSLSNKGMFRSWRLVGTVGTVGVILLVLEMGIRFSQFGVSSLFSFSEQNPISLFTSSHAIKYSERRLGWRIAPNASGFYKGRPFQANSMGFRDKERSIHPKPGVRRIAVLGRSYEMGTGVADGESWPSVLEDTYFSSEDAQAQFGSVEVLNFSVEGYTLNQLELVFYRFAKSRRPDWILIPVFYEEIDTLVPRFGPRIPPFRKLALSASYWLDQLYLPRFLQFSFWRFFIREGSQDWNHLYTSVMEKKKRAKRSDTEPYSTVAQRLVSVIRKEGIQVVIVPMPRIVRTSAALQEKGRRLFEVYTNKRPGVHLVTNALALPDIGPETAAFPGDPHFNKATHRRIAGSIFEGLQEIQRADPTTFWSHDAR